MYIGTVVHFRDVGKFEGKLKSLNYKYEILEKLTGVTCASYEKIFKIQKPDNIDKKIFIEKLKKIKPEFFERL